jgi:NAD(P)-dependent dehydrogenase (short-subunit alcohol dehydrogenase family)
VNQNTQKVVVVTGAAGGIGVEICRRLDVLGYQIVAVDLRPEGLEKLNATLSRPALTVIADLSDETALLRVRDEAQSRYGRCDVLINNAGIVVTTPFEQASLELLRKELDVNLTAPLLLTRAFFPLLQASKGRVITIASLGGILPLAESPVYNASKFGLRGLMMALALRSPITGVKISIVNPASVDTPMLRHEAQTGGSPMNFLGTPLSADRVADVVTRLLSRHRVETDLSASDGWFVRIAMLIPNLFVRILPLLAAIGRRGRQRYITRLGLEALPPGVSTPDTSR